MELAPAPRRARAQGLAQSPNPSGSLQRELLQHSTGDLLGELLCAAAVSRQAVVPASASAQRGRQRHGVIYRGELLFRHRETLLAG